MTDSLDPRGLLNADIKVIGAWIARGLRWWAAELAAMVPASLRRTHARRAPWFAQMQSLSGPVRLWRKGVPVTMGIAAGGAPRPADLALPADAVLVQTLVIPRMAPADLRRLLALNIDRYTPFQAHQVCFDVEVIGPAEDGLRQRVQLAVLDRERARAALVLAAQMGLAVRRMGIADGPGAGVRFDFAAAMQEGAGRIGRRPWLWVLCGGLAGANVLAAVLLDMNDISQLDRLVQAQRSAADLAARLKRRVGQEQDRRLDLLRRRSVQEPLRILDAATRSLPAGAWVQRLEWNGRSVRLVGFGPPGLDPAQALRTPALGNVRSLASDMAVKTAGGQAAFDVMADATASAPR